jgi:hypothetical protein
MVKVMIVQAKCDHCTRPGADDEESIGLFGKVFRLDLCPDCRAELELWTSQWTAGAEVVGTFEPIPPEGEPLFPAVGTYTADGVQLPEPQPGVVWWRTPRNANPATKQRFREAREPIWAWGHEQVDAKGARRFPNLSESCVGNLPVVVGLAWTEEVWLPAQSAPDLREEPGESDESEQALIPAPPKARPKARPGRAKAVAGAKG